MTQTIRQRELLYHYRREVMRELPHNVKPAALIDEAERMRYFEQSARTVGGVVAPFRKQ